MKTPLSLLALLAFAPLALAQVGGSSIYGQAVAKARAEQAERARRTISKDDHPPTPTSTFVEAGVLLNVKADALVAVFSVSQEGQTPQECAAKVDAVVKAQTEELKKAGGAEVTSDFVSQHRIYGYQVEDNTAVEKVVGFELRKNVSVRFTEASQVGALARAAARAQVHDLVKVDYVVSDMPKARERLMEEAARVVKAKVARHERLLGIKLVPPAQVYAERYGAHYPSELYDAHQAHEAEGVLPPRQGLTVRTARKGRAFYFNALDGGDFDAVVHPVVTEPVVQLTLYLKVKYESEQPKAK